MGTRHLRDDADVPDYPTRPLEEATIATSPTSTTDDLFVILDAGSAQQRVGPVRGWQPHSHSGTDHFPVRGDHALVTRADTAYWLITWEAA